MMTKLLPEQISKFWDVIKYAVEQSIPPNVGEHPDKINRILTAALNGKIDVWTSYERGKDINRFEAIVLTKFLYDEVVGMRNLLIYSIYGYDTISAHSWRNGMKTLMKYAKGKGCSLIVAYSNIPEVVKLANSLGAETDFSFISFKLIK